VPGKSTTLTVKIVSDASKAGAGFDAADKKVSGFQRGLQKASGVAGVAMAAIGGLAGASFKAASDLQQSTGAINSVFGDWALDIEQSAQKASQAVGLSQNSYQELAAVIGSQLRGAGMAMGDVTSKTQNLVTKGADLAATFGGSTADAVGALSSALKGEFDPLERYGVSLKQSDINARLAALGQDSLTGSALKTAQANAALSLITDQTASSTGTFARELGTAAGQSATASAAFEDTKAKLGEQLLPVVADGAGKLSTLATWVQKNSGLVKVLAGVLVTAAAVIWAVNFAIAANPFTLWALAIAAVIAVIVIAYNKVGWFRSAVQAAGRVMASAWDGFKSVLSWIWDKLQSVFSLAKSAGSFISNLNPFGAASPGGVAGPALGAAAGVYGATGAPALYGATAGPSLSGTGRAATSSSSAAPVTINVSGALDPQAVARQLRTMLRDLDVSAGRRVTVVV